MVKKNIPLDENKISIKENLLAFFWKIFRIFRYETVYFFDTNMVVSNGKLDSRLIKLFTLNKNFFINDHIKEEVDTLLRNTNYRKVFKYPLKTITFDDLRVTNPSVCPLYYNFISAMHSPAVVWSQNFFMEASLSEMLSRVKISSKEKRDFEKNYMKVIEQFRNQVEIQRERHGKHKLFNFIQNANYKSLKKKREALKKGNKNYLNDLRNMSLALVYCLMNEKNVVFITADVDAINHLQNFTEEITQEHTFMRFILMGLGEEGKNKLMTMSGTFKFNTFEFVKFREGLEGDLFGGAAWKKSSFCFRVKFWDMEIKKYRNFDLVFNKQGQELYFSSHGQLSCECAKNNERGCWIAYKYWWPPVEPDDIFVLKVEIRKKSIINKENLFIENKKHNSICKYIQEDKNNDPALFSHFFPYSKKN